MYCSGHYPCMASSFESLQIFYISRASRGPVITLPLIPLNLPINPESCDIYAWRAACVKIKMAALDVAGSLNFSGSPLLDYLVYQCLSVGNMTDATFKTFFLTWTSKFQTSLHIFLLKNSPQSIQLITVQSLWLTFLSKRTAMEVLRVSLRYMKLKVTKILSQQPITKFLEQVLMV